jgi:hypothetical protein
MNKAWVLKAQLGESPSFAINSHEAWSPRKAMAKNQPEVILDLSVFPGTIIISGYWNSEFHKFVGSFRYGKLTGGQM